MDVLYIGGTGRISLDCVRQSVANGQRVTVFNRGHANDALPEGVDCIVGDLDDPAGYAALGQRHWDVVCQFKAYDLPRVEQDLAVFSGRCGQYVFISSASAYQKPPRRVWLTEDVPLANPYWPYSQAKADMERRLLEIHQAGQLPVTIVRPSHTNSGNLPGTFVPGDDIAWRMQQGRPVVSHGDGTSLWVLTAAEDFAVPFVRLLGRREALGEAYHITSDQPATWDEILGALAEALGVRPEIVHVPTETLVRYNPDWSGPLLGDKAAPVVFDNSKIKALVGEFPVTVDLAGQIRRGVAGLAERLAGSPRDKQLHALLDRIASEQKALGGR